MATGRFQTLVTHVQNLVVPSDNQTPDRELLRRSCQERDESAFAEIVRRHGPMLLRLCRRVLHDGHDLEDVCQAAFLLLAQKATLIRWRDSVASWLFRTTYHLALKTRASADRRTRHEARARPVTPSDPVAELRVRELQAILDEELSRLPEKYRAPILLCCLEGQSRDEVARHLGWKLATVKDRLEQGRERLRIRLARRGVLLGTGLMSAWLLEGGARAAWSNGAAQAVAKAALSIATGQATLAGLLPARVAAVAKGGTLPMFLRRMTLLGIAGVVLGLGIAGVAAWLPAGPSSVQAQTLPAQPAKAEEAQVQPVALALAGHMGPVRAVAFAPGGKFVATAGTDKTVRLWDVATGRQICKLKQPGEAFGVAFAPDGKTLAAASVGPDGALIGWDVATGQEVWRIVSGTEDMDLEPDGKVSKGPPPAGLRVGHLATPGAPAGIIAVAFDPRGMGKRLVAGHISRSSYAVVGVPTTEVQFEAMAPGVSVAAYSPDGKLVAFGTTGGHVLLRDAVSGDLVRNTGEGLRGVTSLAFLPDGSKVAAADGGKAVRILDVSTGHRTMAFVGNEPVLAVAVSPDGMWVATAGKSGQIRLWNSATGREHRRFKAAKGTIHALAFAPDGRWLATVAEDGTAVVWNLTWDDKPLPKDLRITEKELAWLWDDLANDEIVKAHAALRLLGADPVRSVPFLRERLKRPAADEGEKKAKSLIADLDADSFETRERATKELEKLGKAAELALTEALAAGPSLDLKRRLVRLLMLVDGTVPLTPEEQRDVRAVRVLEQAGTPEAKELLEALAKESPGWWVTQEAKAALERLGQRDK